MHRSRLFLLILLSVICCTFSSCTTYNAATGRNEFIYISASEEVSMGKNLHAQISREYKLSKDQALIERVERIGRRVAQVSDRQDYMYNFYVIEKDELNAFTVPGGSVYIFTGLVNKLQSDDQVASVLAHEIGHCAAKHTVKKFQAALGYDLIARLILSRVDPGAQSVANLSSGLIMNIVFSAYGRKDEYEADKLGVKYLYLAGYNPQASMESLEVLLKESKGPTIPTILRSHPHLEDRIRELQTEIDLIKYKYK